MLVPYRHQETKDYRYGFQNQEMDDELKGEGNSLNYTFRMHDPRVGRFFAVDPLARKYAYNSPYAFSENRVIDGVELEGLEFEHYSLKFNSDKNGKIVQTVISHDWTQDMVDWMMPSWEAGKMKKIGEYPIAPYGKAFILNVNGANFIFPTFSALAQTVKDGSWQKLEYGNHPTLAEAEAELKELFNKTDLAGSVLGAVQGIKGFNNLFKKSKSSQLPVQKTPADISAVLKEAEQKAVANINSSGKTVLGSYPEYINLAKQKGASYFDIGSTWDELASAGQDVWEFNKKFLDKVAENGDEIFITLGKDKKPGFYLKEEIEYLLEKKNYMWKDEGKTSLIPKS